MRLCKCFFFPWILNAGIVIAFFPKGNEVSWIDAVLSGTSLAIATRSLAYAMGNVGLSEYGYLHRLPLFILAFSMCLTNKSGQENVVVVVVVVIVHVCISNYFQTLPSPPLFP